MRSVLCFNSLLNLLTYCSDNNNMVLPKTTRAVILVFAIRVFVSCSVELKSQKVEKTLISRNKSGFFGKKIMKNAGCLKEKMMYVKF